LNFIRFHENGASTSNLCDALRRRVKRFSAAHAFYIGQERKHLPFWRAISQHADKEKFHRVEEMVELAAELRVALEKNDLTVFGEILHRGWQLKRGVASGITNSVVEANYQIARDAGAEVESCLALAPAAFCSELRAEKAETST